MTASEELRSIIVDGSPQTDAADRVRFDAADEGDAYPLIVLRRVRIERDFGLDNTPLAKHETFHIECWSDYRTQAQQLEEQVVERLIAAGIPPDQNDPDGIEPEQDSRCCVVIATFIT